MKRLKLKALTIFFQTLRVLKLKKIWNLNAPNKKFLRIQNYHAHKFWSIGTFKRSNTQTFLISKIAKFKSSKCKALAIRLSDSKGTNSKTFEIWMFQIFNTWNSHRTRYIEIFLISFFFIEHKYNLSIFVYLKCN